MTEFGHSGKRITVCVDLILERPLYFFGVIGAVLICLIEHLDFGVRIIECMEFMKLAL